MPIFSFTGYTLMELFRKPDNWWQIYKQTSSNFYTVLGKFPPGKFSPGKFPTIKLPPGKISPTKIPTQKMEYSHPFHCLSSLFLHLILCPQMGKNVHVHPPRMKNFYMSRKAQCSCFRKNSNNQHKLTMSSNRFPSWNLSLVNIESC